MTEYKKLYWCYTSIDHKKYFLIASSARKARSYFANENGLYQKDASVQRICRLPDIHQNTIQIHPDDNLLLDCKVEVITNLFYSRDKISQAIKRMLSPGGRIFNAQNKIFQEEL